MICTQMMDRSARFRLSESPPIMPFVRIVSGPMVALAIRMGNIAGTAMNPGEVFLKLIRN